MSISQEVKNRFLYNAHYVLDSVIPLQKVSKFKEDGTITPEEFIESVDLLILKCPSWSWVSGLEKKQKGYLPRNKQFIIIKGVPCHKRYNVNTHMYIKNDNDLFIVNQLDIKEQGQGQGQEQGHGQMDIDLDFFEEPDLENDVFTNVDVDVDSNSNIKKCRTYDIIVTYDNYYRCARVWLTGYSEDQRPLTQKEIFEDISEEYRNTTVTYEMHPHLDSYYVSIHPCKHANTMKIMIDRLENIRPDKYMFVFLKFIQTIIPTIEYDWTFSV